MDTRLKPHERIGQRFGRLTITGISHKNKYRAIYYFVRCDCGKEKTARSLMLYSGQIKSCGCKKKEHGRRKPVL